MSLFATLAPAMRRGPALRPATALRTFRTSPIRPALSENDTHRDDDRKSHIDTHKHDSISKAKDGKGEWKQELASSSEAAVKADRDDIEASEETIKAMQKETEKMAKESK